MESFKHKLAKELLKEWLIEKKEGEDGYIQLDPLTFRPNRPKGEGIMLEYPVVYSHKDKTFTTGGSMIWDENGLGLKFEGSHPTVEQCFKCNLDVVCVLDIALLHKGTIKYGIEVIHMNKVSEKKKKILEKISNAQHGYITFYSISADWILNQTEIPEKLEMTDIIEEYYSSEGEKEYPFTFEEGGRIYADLGKIFEPKKKTGSKNEEHKQISG